MATIDRYTSTSADIRVKRSKFPMSRRTILSYMHGFLQPVGAPIEVLPGDSFSKVNMAAFTRMSTPIVPFVDNVRQEIDAFFVPKRILWNKTKQFYGEAPSFGVAAKVTEPIRRNEAILYNLSTNMLKCESINAAFGLIMDDAANTDPPLINILTIRGLFAIYNEFYRNENYQDQYSWDKDQSGVVSNLAFRNGVAVTGLDLLPKVNKDKDLFTSILPYQVKGNPVALSIGGKVPVVTGDVNPSLLNSVLGDLSSGVKPIEFGLVNNGSISTGNHYNFGLKSVSSTMLNGNNTTSFEGEMNGTQDSSSGTRYSAAPINLYADLANAAYANISDLLYSLAYQDFLARCAHFGTKYKEYIYGMFGTTIADATEDIPEFLGRLKFNINVQQVVQTTGFQPSTSTELGSLGAYSNSGKSGELFNKSFTEPGYVYFLTYTKHQRTYSSGIDRVFLKDELLDYYQPPFANIADVPIGSMNIWFGNKPETDLGFQEPWFEYYSLQDRAYGMMNPKIDTLGQIWTLADLYASKPTIGAAFMEEDRAAISRVLATGVNGPDYIMDFYLTFDATRVMPLYASGKLGRF